MDLEPSSQSAIDIPSIAEGQAQTLGERLRNFPWWFVGIILTLVLVYLLVLTNTNYREAFNWIIIDPIFVFQGLFITIKISLLSYGIALIFGLIAGLGRVSRNVFARNLATYYVELIRGIPMLVLIFYVAFVFVPDIMGGFSQLGVFIENLTAGRFGAAIAALENDSFSAEWRAVIALSITYGAFLAEIFRAGIESIEKGQMEAARSQGMSNRQAMRYIILPQAIRNILPALANDFIAMVKDSSLVSVLAIRDITQIAKLYTGRSFRFREGYTVLAITYLTLTIVLSMVLRFIEKRMRRDVR